MHPRNHWTVFRHFWLSFLLLYCKFLLINSQLNLTHFNSTEWRVIMIFGVFHPTTPHPTNPGWTYRALPDDLGSKNFMFFLTWYFITPVRMPSNPYPPYDQLISAQTSYNSLHFRVWLQAGNTVSHFRWNILYDVGDWPLRSQTRVKF